MRRSLSKECLGTTLRAAWQFGLTLACTVHVRVRQLSCVIARTPLEPLTSQLRTSSLGSSAFRRLTCNSDCACFALILIDLDPSWMMVAALLQISGCLAKLAERTCEGHSFSTSNGESIYASRARVSKST